MSKLIYPVLLHQKKDKRFYVFKDEKTLLVADRELVSKGIFKDTFIIDSSGKEYSIASVNDRGWATPLWGYSLFIKGRQIKIEFELEYIQSLSFEEFKSFVLNHISTSTNLYSSYVYGPEDIIDSVNSTSTYRDIIEIFY